MSIAKRAISESKDVARLAVDAAKNELIEQLAPTIQAIIDGQLRRGALGEDVDRLRRAHDGAGETEFEEGIDMKKEDKGKVESVASLFPNINEVADDLDEAEDVTEGDEMEEAAVEEDSDPVAEGDEMEEEFELSNEELEAVYQEAALMEVEVKKGFSTLAKPHDFGAGAKGQYQSDPANLMDYQGGEKEWDDVDPPAKQDWTVKEAKIRAAIRRGIAENRALAQKNAKLSEMVQKMHQKLKEMNLLNSKIMHVNKFMAAHRLTNEQKRTVVESIDRGETVKEVKSIYEVLKNSFKASGAVSESAHRAPRADTQRRRTGGGADPKVLRESADRAEGGKFSRLQQLAGIVGG